jgi:hypothetical protein
MSASVEQRARRAGRTHRFVLEQQDTVVPESQKRLVPLLCREHGLVRHEQARLDAGACSDALELATGV